MLHLRIKTTPTAPRPWQIGVQTVDGVWHEPQAWSFARKNECATMLDEFKRLLSAIGQSWQEVDLP
jgi:hypothetical protein